MKFSERTAWNTEESELAAAYRERVAAGLPVLDLTASNPTRSGFEYDADLLADLGDLRGLGYDPEPKGSAKAREAVAGYYRDHGARINPANVVLTTSSSEAYGYLFKLLCNPGDRVLVPQPSYPLFDFLAGVESVAVEAIPLIYDHGWQLDLRGLRGRITEKTRAVVLVHPNNPTGHFTKRAEAEELAAVCRELGLALIVDEVFLDYGLEFDRRDSLRGVDGRSDSGPELTERGPAGRDLAGRDLAGRNPVKALGEGGSFACADPGVLTFIVSGLSKICGLPQMKVAWLLALGPGSEEAISRLEVVADTYLSMNAPIQNAVPGWLANRGAIHRQIRARVRLNLDELDRQLGEQEAGEASVKLVKRLKVEAGWYAILRIPAVQEDERTCLDLLKDGVWVQPGYFYGLGASGWLVVSLLTQEVAFASGIALILRRIQQNLNSY